MDTTMDDGAQPGRLPQTTVLTALPAVLMSTGIDLGVSAATLEQAAGVPLESDADQEKHIGGSVVTRLWKTLIAQLPGHPVGWHLAERLDVWNLGLLGHLLRHRPTLRDGWKTLIRYQRWVDTGLHLRLVEGHDVSQIIVRLSPELTALGHPVEAAVLTGLQAMNQLHGGPASVREIRLPHAPLQPRTHYAAKFGAPVVFEHPEAVIVMANEVLDCPVEFADPSVGHYLERRLQDCLEQLPQPDEGEPIIARLRELVAEHLPDKDIGLRELAQKLFHSPRTLQRRLQEVGLTFADLQQEVRQEQAVRLLGDPHLSISEIARQLGYRDASSFFRAFKRWQGTSPEQFRHQHTTDTHCRELG